MENMDFDIFGDKTGGPSVNGGELPKIPPKASGSAMDELEAEGMITKIRGLCKRAISCVVTAKNLPSNNVEQFSWAIYLMEKALLYIRELANEYENEGTETRFENDMSEKDPQIVMNGNTVMLDFPILMPKRRPNLRTSYYTDRLDQALKGCDIPDCLKEQKVVIAFLHCYQKNHAAWAKRDHDNIDLKWIVDALNNHFFIDDGPFRTSLYNHSMIDEYDHTRIYLIPIEEFPRFLAENIPVWDHEKVRYQKLQKTTQNQQK